MEWGKCHFGWDILEINERIINNRNQLETMFPIVVCVYYIITLLSRPSDRRELRGKRGMKGGEERKQDGVGDEGKNEDIPKCAPAISSSNVWIMVKGTYLMRFQ